jgi:anti-anti-sigma factor
MTVLSMRIIHHTGRSVLLLSGELDILSAPTLHNGVERMIARDRRHLVLDMAGLTFCDSCGLQALLKTQRRLTAAGGTMELTHVHGILQRVLDLTQLSDVFTITADETEDQQLKHMKRMADTLAVTRWK